MKFPLMMIALGLVLLLSACSGATPPISLAPGMDIIKKAIALQVEQTQEQLSEQLAASHPQLDISQVKLKAIEPLYLAKLPTYHIQGTYNLDIDLPNQKVSQKQNSFDVYLQRQREGKTWRWLKRDVSNPDESPLWRTYWIH